MRFFTTHLYWLVKTEHFYFDLSLSKEEGFWATFQCREPFGQLSPGPHPFCPNTNIKALTRPIFPIKYYKSLYLKNGAIKTYEALYFCPFSIVNYIVIEVTKKTATNMHSKLSVAKLLTKIYWYFSLFNVSDDDEKIM